MRIQVQIQAVVAIGLLLFFASKPASAETYVCAWGQRGELQTYKRDGQFLKMTLSTEGAEDFEFVYKIIEEGGRYLLAMDLKELNSTSDYASFPLVILDKEKPKVFWQLTRPFGFINHVGDYKLGTMGKSDRCSVINN